MSNQKRICERVLLVNGKTRQVNKAIEECGELITALCHHIHDSREGTEAVIEEIADVGIMLEQMACLYGYEAVEKKMEEKMARLEKRVEEWEDEMIKKLEKRKELFTQEFPTGPDELNQTPSSYTKI